MRHEPSIFRRNKCFKDDTQTGQHTKVLCTFTYSLFISFLHFAKCQHGYTLLFPCPHSICTHPSVCALMPVCRQNNVHSAISTCLSNSTKENCNKRSTKSSMRRRTKGSYFARITCFLQMGGPKKRHEVNFLEVQFIKALDAFPLENSV